MHIDIITQNSIYEQRLAQLEKSEKEMKEQMTDRETDSKAAIEQLKSELKQALNAADSLKKDHSSELATLDENYKIKIVQLTT